MLLYFFFIQKHCAKQELNSMIISLQKKQELKKYKSMLTLYDANAYG